jgi:hypothetical protein
MAVREKWRREMASHQEIAGDPEQRTNRTRRKFRPKVIGWTLGVLLTAIVAAGFLLPMTPAWLGRRLYAQNFLAYLYRVQLSLKNECVSDQDEDGNGEFMTLAHLLPAADRTGLLTLDEDINEFRQELDEGSLEDFYLVKVHLPDDLDLREQSWCAVAWPKRYDRKTRYTVAVAPPFVAGRLRSDAAAFAWTRNPRYSGWGKGPTVKEVFAGEPFKSKLRWGK